MKRTALFLAAAAMTFTGSVASAQSYGGYGGQRGSDSYGAGRYDNRGGQSWQRGQRLDQRYRSRDRVVSDYSRYRLSRPPRGYSYYRTDNGDILLAAIATGLIASVIAGGFNGDQGYGQPYQGYGQSYQGYGSPYQGGYAQPYGQSYGSGRTYRDAYGRAYTVDQYGRSVWVQ